MKAKIFSLIENSGIGMFYVCTKVKKKNQSIVEKISGMLRQQLDCFGSTVQYTYLIMIDLNMLEGVD